MATDASPTTTAIGKASAKRIRSRLETLATFTEPGPGVSRLCYTPLERQAHDQFAHWMKEAGCSVETDPAGNTIATRPGTEDSLGALGTGSHLDSVYNGGAFDGIAGVVAGVEIAQLLQEANISTRHPLKFVAFAGEEGARFGQACIGSKLAAGMTTLDDLHTLTDRDGITLAQAMESVGLVPAHAAATPWNADQWSAFVELHIEQGNVLHDTNNQIGLVDLISGSTRLQLTMTGRPSHTGGTPMRGRSDALVAASESVLFAEHLALDSAHRGTRATVGKLSVNPNSITTIPGQVSFSLDVRDIDADRQREAAVTIVQRTLAACKRRAVGLDVELLADTSPVILPMLIREHLAEAAKSVGADYRVLTSGASHDSQMINTIIPTGLLFVPSKNGLSHVPEEWTEASEIATGIDVLAATFFNLDSSLNA
ncbi:Zn-dependent hydrolase (plasmid) [Arthrobacter sp. UC242_113]|uniref:Zn-dependent hydrolase n=1 Tax=Arthrobacter sp. UC242_113 TaxID=3374550 RepID=UPI00375830CF